jgi:hypothetical protein
MMKTKKIKTQFDEAEILKILTSNTTRDVKMRKLSQVKIGNRKMGTQTAKQIYDNYQRQSDKKRDMVASSSGMIDNMPQAQRDELFRMVNNMTPEQRREIINMTQKKPETKPLSETEDKFLKSMLNKSKDDKSKDESSQM